MFIKAAISGTLFRSFACGSSFSICSNREDPFNDSTKAFCGNEDKDLTHCQSVSGTQLQGKHKVDTVIPCVIVVHLVLFSRLQLFSLSPPPPAGVSEVQSGI